MEEAPRVPEATELVYVPEPSWIPLFSGAGLAGVLVGLFAGWVYAIVGAIVLVFTVAAWIRKVGIEVSRMPRRQRISSAVIPPIPPRPQGR